jgi:hypothetical protein
LLILTGRGRAVEIGHRVAASNIPNRSTRFLWRAARDVLELPPGHRLPEPLGE